MSNRNQKMFSLVSLLFDILEKEVLKRRAADRSTISFNEQLNSRINKIPKLK